MLVIYIKMIQMKYQLLKSLTLIVSFSLLVSCSNNTIDDISEEVEVIETVTYENVKGIFNSECTSCHSNPTQNGAPMPLVNYQNVKEAVLDRGLLDRISRQEGEDGLMPFGGPRLPQQTIDLIFQWNADGLLEN
jgi:hypothetical protein